jgi:hypothetical protein
MASKQLKLMNDLYASIKERVSKPSLDLATNRDIVENLHLAATEPEAVTYAEVDADGVPALWCIPRGIDSALARFDIGEAITWPSLADASRWDKNDEARSTLFAATQTRKPAPRYKAASTRAHAA